MEVGVFLIKLIKIVVLSYFAERVLRLLEKNIKLKELTIKQQKYDKDFWG